MFHTYTDSHEELDEKPAEDVAIAEARLEGQRSKSSSASSSHGWDAIERTPTQDDVEHEDYEESEKQGGARAHPSTELKRTASNALSKVASRLTTRSIRDPPPPPDGGLAAWTQVACGWIVIMVSWGYVNSFGSFQTYYTDALPQSASTISWIGSIQVWLTFFIGAFSGRLLDAGLFVPTLFVGAVLQVLGIFLMSISTKYWHLMLTQGILTGIGGGIFFCPSMGLIATYFSKRRGMAIGLASTGNSVGGIIYPVIVRQLLPKIGFGWTARVLGFVNLGCLALVLVFMRPRLPPRSAGPIIDLRAFKEPVFLCFVSGIFFVIWAIYFVFYYIASYATEVIHMPYTESATMVIILNGVGFPARIIPPFFADRYGPLNVLVPALSGLTIITYAWLAVDNAAGYYTFSVFYGVFSAAFQCLIPTTVASLTPDLNVVGTRLGMNFATLSFAALTGPPLGGALQSAGGGSYLAPQIWAGTSTLLCVGLVLSARVCKGGWKLGSWC